MRIWSLHPKYLDQPKGLGGLWKEALQCQDVILGITDMHRNHPQRLRWLSQKDPLRSLSTYLLMLHDWVSEKTSYNYNKDLIVYKNPGPVEKMSVTSDQLGYEARHLVNKLTERAYGSNQYWMLLREMDDITPHPLFKVITGPIEPWEKTWKKKN